MARALSTTFTCWLLAAMTTGTSPALELTWLPSDVRLDTDPAGESASDYPKIAADGSDVYVVWEDERNGFEDIYLNYSHDKGRTWLATDRRINRNVAGASHSVQAAIAATGQRVYVAWADTRNGTSDIYFNSSSNAGQTWRASDIRLDSDPAGSHWSREPSLVAAGSHVCVLWKDGRDNQWQTLNSLYVNCSSDGGSSWRASDLALVTNGGAEITQKDLVATDGWLYVFYDQYRTDRPNVYFNSSADWGTSWEGEVKVNHSTTGECRTPAMAASGGNVYATWWWYYSYHNELMFNRSTDHGATWSPTDTHLAWSGSPDVAADGGSVQVVFPGDENISLQASTDAGASWLPTPTVVRPYDVKDFDSYQVFSSGDTVLVSWRDYRCLDYSIWVNASADGGVTFEPLPTALNDTFCNGTARADDPQTAIVASERLMYVVWDEYRGLKQDIFVNAGSWVEPIFADDFESGDLDEWSASAP